MRICPDLGSAPGLAATTKGALPGPCTEAPVEANRIHDTELSAVQEQLAELGTIRATPVPPCPVKLTGIVLAVAVHVEPACVITTGFPAIMSVAVRAEKLFGGAYMDIAAEPVPLEEFGADTLSHGELDDAVQKHPDGSDKLISRVPPFESNAYAAGVSSGSWHDPTS